jgi:Rhodopirellula transposase DDE domain
MEQGRALAFCHIFRNWQGVLLDTLEVVVNLICSTTTEEGQVKYGSSVANSMESQIIRLAMTDGSNSAVD